MPIASRLTVQTLDGDTVNGEFKEVEDVLFDDKGKRESSTWSSPPGQPWWASR